MTQTPDCEQVLLNNALDRLPQSSVVLGSRDVSLFQLFGLAGTLAAFFAYLAVGLSSGITPIVLLAVSAAAGFSFFGFARLRRRIAGREVLVLFEQVWVSLVAITGTLWFFDVPVNRGLDVCVVGLAVFLAFGRIGCLTTGCCYGVSTRSGICYRDTAAAALPPRLRTQRLMPVQLLEAVGLFVIGLIAAVLVDAQAGTATTWFLISYALLRVFSEQLRGDDRPWRLGAPVPVLSAFAQLIVGLVLSLVWLAPELPNSQIAVGGVLVFAMLVATMSMIRRQRAPLEGFTHLNETWELALELLSKDDSDPVIGSTSEGLLVAVTRNDAEAHISLSHQVHPTMGVGRSLRPTAWQQGALTHVEFDILTPSVRSTKRATTYFKAPNTQSDGLQWSTAERSLAAIHEVG